MTTENESADQQQPAGERLNIKADRDVKIEGDLVARDKITVHQYFPQTVASELTKAELEGQETRLQTHLSALRWQGHWVEQWPTGHVGVLSARVYNPRPERIQLDHLTFITQRCWQLPQPGAFATSIEMSAPREMNFVRVRAAPGSIAHLYFGAEVEPEADFQLKIAILTDHATSYPVGLFPFLLNWKLVYGGQQHELPGPPLLLSLHQQRMLGMTQLQPLQQEYADLSVTANDVLSHLSETVLSDDQVLANLKQLATRRF